ncbi:MAG: GAF domain-containing protein [Terriglobales bacterium]
MPATPPPAPEEPALTPAEWVAEARRLQAHERNTSALAAFERALQLDGAYAPAWLGKALLLEDLNRWEPALAAYDALLAHAAGNAALATAAWSNRAGLLLRAERFPEALDSLDHALALDPGNHLFTLNKGLLLLQGFERPLEALPWLERAAAAGVPEAEEPLAYCRDELLAALSAVATGAGTRLEKFSRAATTLQQAGGYRWLGLYGVDRERGLATNLVWAGAAGPAHPDFPSDRGLTGRALRTAATVNVGDVGADADYLPTLGETRSEIIVPIFDEHGSPLGTLDVESDQPEAFSPPGQAFLEHCAEALRPLWTSAG